MGSPAIARPLSVYDLASPSPAEPVGSLGNSYSGAVAIDGPFYLVGNPGDDTVMSEKGSAALYGNAAFSPVATLSIPGDVKSTSATLRGTVNPNGWDTEVHFEYGPTTTYGSQTPPFNPGRGFGPQPVSAGITGLTPDSEYHFRLVATYAGGTVIIEDAVFHTSHPGYAEWAELHNTGPFDSDDDADGVMNLLEFAFSLNPRDASSSQIPQPVVLPNGQVRLETTLPSDYGGVRIGAEYSTDLTLWTAMSNSGTEEHPIFMAPTANGHQFVRWKITLLP